MSEVLRDRYGWKIGEIRIEGSKRRLFDRYGYLLGWYKERVGMTFDRYGMMIGRGYLLATLLDRDMWSGESQLSSVATYRPQLASDRR